MAYKNLEFISQETIRDILKDTTFQKELNNFFTEDLQLITVLRQMCNMYLKMLKSENEIDQKASYALGTNIIFNLRRVLLNRDITILVGATAPKTNKNLRLGEYSLTELLKKSSNYNINQNELDIIAPLENWENLNSNTQAQRNAVWKRILDAQELTGPYQDFDASKPEGKTKLDKKEIELYRRNRIDMNVYYGYNNKNEIISYYKTGGHSFHFFNQGWLFEHFMEKWMNASNQEQEIIIKQSKSVYPVKIAIEKNDSVPGIQGGDFRKGNKDYQAKYGNQKIISIASIESTVNKIIQLLNTYEKNLRQLGVEFANLFTNKNNIDKGIVDINKEYEEIVEDLGKNFSKKFLVQIKI